MILLKRITAMLLSFVDGINNTMFSENLSSASARFSCRYGDIIPQNGCSAYKYFSREESIYTGKILAAEISFCAESTKCTQSTPIRHFTAHDIIIPPDIENQGASVSWVIR